MSYYNRGDFELNVLVFRLRRKSHSILDDPRIIIILG